MGRATCEIRGVLIAPSLQDRPSIEQSLTSLFDAERTVRRLHDELARQPEAALLATLTAAINAALHESDEDEAGLRLVRISSLLGELKGKVLLTPSLTS